MNQDDHVCVCHKVSMGKITKYLERENPKVASLLSECLGAGTGCGWCVPFLKKLHKQHQAGEPMDLGIDFDRYFQRRDAYKSRSCTHEVDDG